MQLKTWPNRWSYHPLISKLTWLVNHYDLTRCKSWSFVYFSNFSTCIYIYSLYIISIFYNSYIHIDVYYTYLGPQKTHFFLVIRLRLFFWVITAMHFVQANVAIYVFFSTFRYAFFSTKCWKIMALLCLWLWNQGHIWPYLPIYGHIWQFFGHPESTASIRFDHFFWSLRVIVVIDEIFCVLRGLAKTTEKKHVYVVTGTYTNYSSIQTHMALILNIFSLFQRVMSQGCLVLLIGWQSQSVNFCK